MLKSISKRLLVIILVTYAPITFAQTSEQILGLTEVWTPFNCERNDEVVGISTDLVKAILDHAEIDYKLEIKPWKRAYKTTLKTKNTILFTTNRIPSREDLFYWIGPIYEQDIAFYHLAGRTDIQLTELEDLKQYRVAVTRGGSVAALLKERGFIEDKHFYSYSNEAQAEKMLTSRHVDLIPTSDLIHGFRIKQKERGPLNITKALVIEHAKYYIAVNKKTSKALVEKMNASFHRVVELGIREQIKQRYLSTSP
jgi:polar amino acid transport system substrate-binding protein